MSKFLFILNQESGCDYTIHCGTLVKIVEADNLLNAYKDIQENYGLDSDMSYDEYPINIRVFDITNSVCISKNELKEELKEYNEYLKLKSKFENE